VIHKAYLESQPSREWQMIEQQLIGIPVRAWQEQIHVQ